MREPFIVTGENADGARESYACAQADDALGQARAMSVQGLQNVCIVDADDYAYEVAEFETISRQQQRAVTTGKSIPA